MAGLSAWIEPSRGEAVSVRIRGLVQGVGFRPTVWRLASETGLSGEVHNDGNGVLIRAAGTPEQLRGFLVRLRREAPPLSRIDGIEVMPLAAAPGEMAPSGGGFRIVESVAGAVRTGIVPDAASCPACLAEVEDPSDRRYRYPFTNCTHCGPRLSILRAIPYDRANSSMAPFALCPDCAAEYGDPADRRFHAQPNACAACGPRLWLEDEGGACPEAAEGRDAIEAALARIAAGAIVAVKGIGGFQLACDAADEAAVARLRRRKRRFDKPFALMARDLAMVRRYARVEDVEATLLQSAAAPIVLLDRRETAPPLAPGIAPGQSGLGFMLPCSPLHHLLAQGLDRPLVLTSGNRSEEPQCLDNGEARRRLAGITDLWLLHDREIVNRLDYSLVRVAAGRPRLLRRARGYAPAPLGLPAGFEAAPAVLAMGGELKNSFCLLKHGRAILSPHIGDLEDPLTHADYRRALALFRALFEVAPALVAVDAHPDYHASQWGRRLAEEEGLAVAEVQHHHAHLAACLAESGRPLDAPPVLGVILDGLGFGAEGGLWGELWGGELLLADYRRCERLGHFAPVALPGGEAAMREPWRNAYAQLAQFLGWESVARAWPDLPIVRFLSRQPLRTLDRMIARGINAPPASSAGRLFDAVAAALGLCTEATSFEGQAAMALEALAETAPEETAAYPVDVADGETKVLGWTTLWRALLDDLAAGVAPARIAARFHNGLIAALVSTAGALAAARALDCVVLSGGVFQNRILLEGVTAGLEARALNVLSPEAVPANDGGLSLGQACIAAARRLDGPAGRKPAASV